MAAPTTGNRESLVRDEATLGLATLKVLVPRATDKQARAGRSCLPPYRQGINIATRRQPARNRK